jgi:hypothetical protein
MCARHVLSDAHAQQSVAELKATLEALQKEFDAMKGRDVKGVRVSLYALACVCIISYHARARARRTTLSQRLLPQHAHTLTACACAA